MFLDVKNWLLSALIVAACTYGIVRAATLDCGTPHISVWLIGWYLVIMAYRFLYVIAVHVDNSVREPGSVVIVVGTTVILLSIFASIWTFIGTNWIVRDLASGNPCLNGLERYIALAILSAIYLFYALLAGFFVYFIIMDTRNASFRKKFLKELNKIYNDKQHASHVNVKGFVAKYKTIMASEPMMDIEKNILKEFCSVKVANSDEKAECGICLLEFEPQEVKTLTPCKHAFHYSCIIGWYQLKSSCPYCRQSFREGLLQAYIDDINQRLEKETVNAV